VWNLADTPITMTRNRAVLMAREHGVDVLVMVDSDMKPDILAGQPDAKPFFKSSFDFLVDHYHKGPCCIGAPYCGPPPVECVYVFRWNNWASENPNPDFQLEMYDRHTAVKLAGIQECAALPTGLIMYDMRCFDLTEPKADNDKPWFYYEWKDRYASEKASTEDVTQTRDLSLVGTQKLGYSPVYCNWDAWAGHWKPKCVSKPQVIDAKSVSSKLKDCWDAKVDSGTKLIDLPTPKWLEAVPFNGLGMDLHTTDADAIRKIVRDFIAKHGRAPKVAEIGSWAGRSALIMVEAGATVTCIDHWEGNKNDSGTKGVDAATAFKTFLANTKQASSAGKLRYFRGSSRDAAEHFAGMGERFDIVYIDAEHDYDSVMADIALWRPLAMHVVAGHDYGLFHGVTQAVREQFKDFQTQGTVWSSSV
jgi:hypothetical protein